MTRRRDCHHDSQPLRGFKVQAYNRKSGKPDIKKFRKEPRYTHHRSEGLTRRTNKGSALQPKMGRK